MGCAQSVVDFLPRIKKTKELLQLLVSHIFEKAHVAVAFHEELLHVWQHLLACHGRSFLCHCSRRFSFGFYFSCWLCFAAISDSAIFLNALCFTPCDGFLSGFLLFFFASIVE